MDRLILVKDTLVVERIGIHFSEMATYLATSNLLLVVNVDFVECAAGVGAGALASDGEGFAVR